MDIEETVSLTIRTDILWLIVWTIGFAVLTGLVYLATNRGSKPGEITVLPRLHRHPALNIVGLFAIPFFFVWAALLGLTLKSLYDLWIKMPDPNAMPALAYRMHYLAIVGMMTALAGLIGAPLALIRIFTTERETTATEEGLITDRITRAVAGLGAEKVVKNDGKERTAPNLEVRIGAIYALERIAQDSDRDHVQIMEILCAYIRQNAPASEAVSWPEIEMYEDEEDGPLRADWKERKAAFKAEQDKLKASLTCRADIQTALTVIGRRSAHQRALEARAGHEDKTAKFVFNTPCPALPKPPEDGGYDPAVLEAFKSELRTWKQSLRAYPGYRLDLRRCNLQGADMSKADISGADLNDSQMQGAVLFGAQMQGANLWEAQMQGANLWEAQMQGAVLGWAQMQGANLWEAQMQGADLWEAQMQGADLWKAQMQGADLRKAQMQGADLREAQMQGADLREAQMQGADLWKAQMQGADLRKAQMQGADLREAQMQGADLREAQMQGTDLGWAQMQGADLWEAQMQGAVLFGAQFDSNTSFNAATLRGAALKDVNCNNLPQLLVHAADFFADASVETPDGFDRPDHWPRFVMDWSEFYEQWHKWLADPDTYTPPAAPNGAPG